ncbi:MAG: extracellular solute-binding protein [Lachnospiraceae bacterium]|nr:extracellular solute-binding protein [Lachnospiraceae bacterium]
MRINLKSIITCLILATIILFLIFCEKSEAAPLDEEDNLLASEWKISGEPVKNISLYYSDFYGDLFNDSFVPGISVNGEYFGSVHAASDDKIYYISNVNLRKEDEVATSFSQRIQIYDCNTKELTTNYCIEDIAVESMTISNGKLAILYKQAMDTFNRTYASMLWEDGTLLKGIRTDTFIQSELISAKTLKFDTTVYEGATDRYITVCSDGEMIVASRLGHVLAFFKGDKGVKIKPLFQTKGGTWIFKETDSHGDIQLFYINDLEKEALYRGKELYISNATEDDDGNIVYRKTGEGDFIKWNVKTGEREIICSTEPSFVRGADFVINDDGDLYVYIDNDLRVFSQKVKTRTIKVQQVANSDKNIERAIKEYEETHPEVKFEYVKTEKTGDTEDAAAENIKKMKDGSVDIAFLDNDTFLDYVNAGCIRDISDIYSEEDMENMFDVFKEASTVDGKILRYPSLYNRDLLITKSGVLADGYSATDLINLINMREQAGKPYEAICYGSTDPFEIFLRGMDVSEFFDYQKGTCNFTAGNFVSILKQCKKYHTINKIAPITAKEQYDALLDEKVLFISIGSASFNEFDEMKKILGGKGVIAGYPTKAENGNVTSYNGSLVVSKNTKNYDLIEDFLKYLYKNYWGLSGFSLIPTDKASFDGIIINKGDPMPIDKRAYEAPEGYTLSVTRELYNTDTPMAKVTYNGYMMLAGREDGTSYADEYMNYYDTLRLPDERFRPIEEILEKEVELMYQTDADEAEVAARIQKQVGEYLKTLE